MRIKYLLGVALFTFICVGVLLVTRSNKQVTEDNYEVLECSVPEYDSLFNPSIKRELTDFFTYKNKFREPLVICHYHEYFLLIYKIKTLSPKKISETVEFTRNDEVRPEISGYDMGNKVFDILYKSGAQPDSISNLFFSINSDSLKTSVANDSVISLYANLNNLMLRYQQKDDVDFLIKTVGAEIFTRYPTCLRLQKREQDIYLMLLTVRKKGDKMTPDLLNQIMRN